ncbi:hypothetical protein Z949_2887 [Sulfitobacter guttiformis KCTC 32187]|nr:hypothetical protein Z949_2887 [Sulfitobacter guttiformis KCTC 32187]
MARTARRGGVVGVMDALLFAQRRDGGLQLRRLGLDSNA